MNKDIDHKNESIGPMKFEYLLKELEIQHEIEVESRSRTENVGQFYFTALTAIIGGIILIIQTGQNDLLNVIAIFIGAALMLSLSFFTFRRFLVYRAGLTEIRIKRFLIRKLLCDYGIGLEILVPSNKNEHLSGFGRSSSLFLTFFALFCGTVAALISLSGISFLLRITGQVIFKLTFSYVFIYLIPGLVFFFVIFTPLIRVLRNSQTDANHRVNAYLKKGFQTSNTSEITNEPQPKELNAPITDREE